MTSQEIHDKIESVKFTMQLRENVLDISYMEMIEAYIAKLEVQLNNK